MTNLILPEHIAEQRDREQNDPLSLAYVKPEDRVLDPSKLPQDFIGRLPQPTGWRILVLPYRGKPKTKGGIILSDETQETAARATVAGYVLKVGPDAYRDQDKFPAGPWCKEGEWILFGRYAGARFKIEGGEVRILNDDEIIATIADPDDILFV
jgi:co-chaperonin GroES (HSP10)